MSDAIYKHIILTGTSPHSIEEAVNNALAKAAHSVRNLSWFVVRETRGNIDGNQVRHWQVTVEVGFVLEE